MGIAPPSKEAVQAFFILIAKHNGNKSAAAREMGMPISNAWNWIEVGARYGLTPPAKERPDAKGRRYSEVTDGVVYVAGDAHYLPGEPSTAHRALCKFLKGEKVHTLIMNGDAYDFPGISRHDSDWFQIPTIQQELEVVDERLGELIKVSGKAKRFFCRGNHDIRYDRYLARNAPEMRDVANFTIDDRLPLWDTCWSVWINDRDGAVVKHRPGKGGMHSTTNSPLWAGRTTVCNHLHNLQVRPIVDYNGIRWGVDCGTLCDIYAPQFSYLEDAPRSWVSGFVRLKFISGKLLTPELIRVVEPGLVEFRGELIEV